jgi:hypothetical protein
MYHFEFYSIIKSLFRDQEKAQVLSGIYGDVWAGSWKFAPILNASQVKNLAVTHKVEASHRIVKSSYMVTEKEKNFFDEFHEELKDPIYRVVSAARMKMILIRHLIETPRALGFNASSPFLDVKIATAMMTIDPERRENRAWQREYLDANCPIVGKNSGSMFDFNISDLHGAQKVKLPILSTTQTTPMELRKFDVEKISKKVQITKIELITEVLLRAMNIPAILNRLRIKHSTFEESYADYVILYPLISIFGKIRNKKGVVTLPIKL